MAPTAAGIVEYLIPRHDFQFRAGGYKPALSLAKSDLARFWPHVPDFGGARAIFEKKISALILIKKCEAVDILGRFVHD